MAPPLDFEKIKSGWSPNRADRPAKVDEVDKVMWGAYVVNKGGVFSTIAFCFEDEERTGVFGLTVAHLVNQIGDVVYMFDHKNDPETGTHFIKRLGVVVEISRVTDSMVFKLDQGVESEVLAFVPSSGLCQEQQLRLPQPTSRPSSSASNMSSSMDSTLVSSAGENELAMGQPLACYGAKRRGAIGDVSTLYARETHDDVILQGDIGITGAEPTKALTECGDCGAIWMNESGVAVSMHHGLMTTCKQSDNGSISKCYESYGVPMQRIVDAHASLGGQSTTAAQSMWIESRAQSAETMSEATTWVQVRYDIGHCEVMVRDVDAAGHIFTSYQIGSIPVSIRL